MRKRIGIVAVMTLLAVATFADEADRPAAFQVIIGPRIGASFHFTTPAEFTEMVETLYPPGSYVPVTSLFGVIAEQRILLGDTDSHFAFQEVVMIGGLEQSIALPTASFLIGYRDSSGFEVGFGPNVTLAGIGVVVAAGYTISYRGVFVPIDLSCVLPNAQRPASVALTTGFNFITRSRTNTF